MHGITLQLLPGQKSPPHIVYPNFKENVADMDLLHWNMRDMMEAIEALEMSAFISPTGHKELAKALGLNRRSILLRLNHLYGWDIANDGVFDVMHVLLLCIVQNLLNHMMQMVDDNRLPLLNAEHLKARSKALFDCWPCEIKQKRVPRLHEFETKGKLPVLKGKFHQAFGCIIDCCCSDCRCGISHS
jgi:hypothetical protein